jgi:hypothetical protein
MGVDALLFRKCTKQSWAVCLEICTDKILDVYVSFAPYPTVKISHSTKAKKNTDYIYKIRKMINVHHMYNKGTTPLSHGVGSTHCGIHPM